MKVNFLYICVVFVFIMQTTHVYSQIDINILRFQYRKAADSEKLTNWLHGELEKKENNLSSHNAYKAAIIAVKAKFAFWPNEKLSLVKKAMTLLDKCIIQDPNNIEKRWLRYSIEINIPSVLGYNHQTIDRKVIIDQLTQKKFDDKDRQQMVFIGNFMKQFAKLTTQEIKQLSYLF